MAQDKSTAFPITHPQNISRTNPWVLCVPYVLYTNKSAHAFILLTYTSAEKIQHLLLALSQLHAQIRWSLTFQKKMSPTKCGLLLYRTFHSGGFRSRRPHDQSNVDQFYIWSFTYWLPEVTATWQQNRSGPFDVCWHMATTARQH